MRHGENYENAAGLTLENGGGTFTVAGEVVHHGLGYHVGGLVPTSIVPVSGGTAFIAESIARFARQHYREIGHHDAYIGAWVKDGNVYIDASQWVATRDEALALGADRGELAIWDCRAGSEVTP